MGTKKEEEYWEWVRSLSLEDLYILSKTERYDLYGMAEFLSKEEIESWYKHIHKLEEEYIKRKKQLLKAH